VARVAGDDVAVMYAGRLVERGTVDRVLGSPRHPYTSALLGALPLPGVARGELQAIPGQPPSPGERPWDDACAFAARCTHAVGACRTHRPPLVELRDGQWSACDLIGDRPPAVLAAATEANA
jgi:oligopeptide/dipeptide ABC transporter ATP-binding protein